MSAHPAPLKPVSVLSTTHPFFALLGVLVCVVCGSAVAVQSRINGLLAVELADPYLAAVVSFGGGLVLLMVGSLLIPAGRRGFMALPELLRSRVIRWWYLLAGFCGAALVITQTLTVQVLGVSVFILGIVVGQSLGGLLVDRLGLGPGGAKALSRYRILGTVLIVLSVLVAVLPRLSTGGTHLGSGALVAMGVMPVFAGVLTTVQTAWNGHIASATGTPMTSTLTNFTAGTAALAVMYVVSQTARGFPSHEWPSQWWLYLGGPLGILFVAVGAVFSRTLGVLQTSLSIVTGMLLGGLALDVFMPTPSTVVNALTIAGTLFTLVGLLIVTLPWRRREAI